MKTSTAEHLLAAGEEIGRLKEEVKRLKALADTARTAPIGQAMLELPVRDREADIETVAEILYDEAPVTGPDDVGLWTRDAAVKIVEALS